MHGHHGWDESCGRWAGRRHGWGGFGFGPPAGGFWGAWGGGPLRGGRMFGQGDLRYIILQLLAEKPRHGYDIIKELEDRFGGAYSPSPGTVYPTLAMLEDQGYAVARSEEGKKVYEITEEGRRFLAENRTTVDDIFARIGGIAAALFSDAMVELHRAARDLAGIVYRHAAEGVDPDKVKRVREVLERAARDIEAIWSEPKPPTT